MEPAPHRPSAGTLLACASLMLGAQGCNTPVYFPGNRMLVADAATGGADSDLFVLPVRVPSSQEQRALEAEQRRLGLPLPVAWAGVRDFAIEIAWIVSNQDPDAPTSATWSLVGGNEFGDYQPGLYVDATVPAADQLVPPPLEGQTPLELAPGERRSGVFREDELDEAALDLEAILRYPPPGVGLATPFVVIEHWSSRSRAGLDAVPPRDPIPAMVRYQLALSSSGSVTAEYSVRVRDHNGKLAAPNARSTYVSTAAILPPVAVPAP